MSEALTEPNAIDRAELEISKLQPVEAPLIHTFTPGLYVRQILMRAGSVLTSRIHKTTHPFIILTGEISVISENERITYKAPYIGITLPGTRRVLYAHTDTVWLTVHANPNDIEDPDELVEQITDDAKNPLFEDHDDPRLNIWKKDVSESLCLNFTGPEHQPQLLTT